MSASPPPPTPPRKAAQSTSEIDLSEAGGALSSNLSPLDSGSAPKDQARYREKKRVGFLNLGAAKETPSKEEEPENPFADDADTPPESARTPVDTAVPTPVVENRDSVDAQELTTALQRILSNEPEHRPPTKPRSVLRKPRDQPQGNAGSGETPEDQIHRSEVAAKHRADRLAVDLSNTGSQRNSLDTASSETWGAPAADWRARLGLGGRYPRGHERRSSAPESLRRGGEPEDTDFEDDDSPFPKSGQITPIGSDLEYVPRPDKYRSGILHQMMKLYHQDRSSPGSKYNSAVSTPNRTPKGSPPSSAPATPVTPVHPSRPRSSLFGLRTNHGGSSNSVTTLSGLISSSTNLMGPGSSNIAEAMSEKVRQEKKHDKRDRSKSPKRHKLKQAERQARLEEKIRIKIHIAHTISRQKYLVKLCKALMLYGAPTHRLEGYMAMSARVLAIEGQFLYLPGCMIISFDDSKTHTTEVKIVRTGQGVDFGRLHDVHRIYKEVVHDLIGVEEATQRLDEVMQRKDKFNVWVRIFLSGCASACVGPFAFEARFIDLPMAFLLGCILGILQIILAARNELYSNVFEITAAIVTSFLARALGSIRDGNVFCFSALAQSSIALILPGYMVLCSSLELQNKQMITGSVRMVYAMIYTLFLGYGITIGSVLYGYADRQATSSVHCIKPLNTSVAWKIIFVCLFTLCLCILNQAKWKQMPVMLVISVAGYCVSNFSSGYFRGNSQVSNTLGALAIGVLANLYARLGRHIENFALDVWEHHLQPKIHGRRRRKGDRGMYQLGPYGDSEAEAEAGGQPAGKPAPTPRRREVGYGLAAAAMLPAIFVQVPGGIASGGSLFNGVQSADQITGNSSTPVSTDPVSQSTSGLDGIAFGVLGTVIQVAIGISVGLSLSALIVYPLGKRRSGLFSF